MKNIFICHRPYHILRCCDMINREYKERCENILITFEVKQAKSTNFQKFETHQIFYSYFDDVVELPRGIEPSVRSIRNYHKYCKTRKAEYKELVEKNKDAEALYFFADNELEIEILVGMLRTANPSMKSILVDEGLVTYSEADHHHSWKRKLWLGSYKLLSGLKYFNIEKTYGYSNLYNLSLANKPEKAVFFHPPVKQLQALSESTCSEIRRKITSKMVPDYSKPYLIYVGTYEKSFEEDLPRVQRLKEILDNNRVNFYIKLHPQQNEELYLREFGEGVLLEKGIPIELFFSKHAIMAGTISSSLFNASLQGYYAMDVSYLFPEESRLNWVQMPITQQFDWIDVKPICSYKDFEVAIKSFKSSLA